MPVVPVFSGGSTKLPFGPPNDWITPTDGFPGLPTIAMVIVTTPRLGTDAAADCIPQTDTATRLAKMDVVNPILTQSPPRPALLRSDLCMLRPPIVSVSIGLHESSDSLSRRFVSTAAGESRRQQRSELTSLVEVIVL